MDLQKSIYGWAERAVKTYLELVHGGFDYGFYTQSDLRDISVSPDYFIIQINPGSPGSYQEQITNPNWFLNGNDMDATHFIQGNYSREPGKQSSWERRFEWPNFTKLRSLFSLIQGENPLDNVKCFVLTNASCFNTPTAVKDLYKTLPYTIPVLMDLIETIKPKRIIVLGCKLPQYLQQANNSVVIKDSPYNRVKYGTIKEIETLYIDHPSARTPKKDIKRILSLWGILTLEAIMDSVNCSEPTSSPYRSVLKLDAQHVEDLVNKHYEYCSNDSKHPHWHFPLGNSYRLCTYGKGNNVQVYCPNDELLDHPIVQQICEDWRTKYGFQYKANNKHLIGFRKVSDYRGMSDQEVAETIIEAFDSFISKVQALDLY